MDKIHIRLRKLILASTMGIVLSFGGIFMPLYTVSAACGGSGFLGFPTWYKYLQLDDNCKIVGPAKTIEDNNGNAVETVDISKAIPRVVLAVIDILMRLAGMAAFAFIVISGFKFVLSQGSPDKEKQARQSLINAVIGLVISIFAIGATTALANYLVK